jgi:anti-sigma factor RsiW
MNDGFDTIRCAELVEVISDYLEGALPPNQRKEVEYHLARCPGCANYVEQMRQTIRLSGKLKEEPIPEDVSSRMVEAFRGFVRRRQS